MPQEWCNINILLYGWYCIKYRDLCIALLYVSELFRYSNVSVFCFGRYV